MHGCRVLAGSLVIQFYPMIAVALVAYQHAINCMKARSTHHVMLVIKGSHACLPIA
jgi:hypothetical protein